jgi:hypothetical protein
LNSAAISVTVSETVKKSIGAISLINQSASVVEVAPKASQAHPKKPAKNINH